MKYQRTILPELADDSRMRRQVWMVKKYGKPYQSTVAYFDKAFLKNLKANMSFAELASKKELPVADGEIQMFMYQPVGAGEGFVSAQIGEYADYMSFTDSALETAVAEVASDLAYKLAASMNALIEATADAGLDLKEVPYKMLDKDGDEVIEIFKSLPDGQFESLGLHKAKDWGKLKS